MHWLAQFYLNSIRQEQNQDMVATLVSTMVDSAAPLLTQDIPEKIVLSACQLLLSLATTVRPRFLASLPAMQGLMEKAARSQLTHLPQRVGQYIYIYNMYVLY